MFLREIDPYKIVASMISMILHYTLSTLVLRHFSCMAVLDCYEHLLHRLGYFDPQE